MHTTISRAGEGNNISYTAAGVNDITNTMSSRTRHIKHHIRWVDSVLPSLFCVCKKTTFCWHKGIGTDLIGIFQSGTKTLGNRCSSVHSPSTKLTMNGKPLRSNCIIIRNRLRIPFQNFGLVIDIVHSDTCHANSSYILLASCAGHHTNLAFLTQRLFSYRWAVSSSLTSTFRSVTEETFSEYQCNVFYCERQCK